MRGEDGCFGGGRVMFRASSPPRRFPEWQKQFSMREVKI